MHAHLEYRGSDETLQEPESGGAQVVKATAPRLKEAEKEKGDEEGDECCSKDWDNFFANWIGELGVDNVAILKIHWE
jgi:hypothetical protein